MRIDVDVRNRKNKILVDFYFTAPVLIQRNRKLFHIQHPGAIAEPLFLKQWQCAGKLQR
jgi:hypothetical protein